MKWLVISCVSADFIVGFPGTAIELWNKSGGTGEGGSLVVLRTRLFIIYLLTFTSTALYG